MLMMRRWVTDNLGSAAWLLLAPAAAWVPHLGLKTHFDFHLRPRIGRMLPFLDPYVSIHISSKPDFSSERIKSSDAYEEVKAYLSPASAREAKALNGDGAAEGDGFVLSPCDGQQVSDEFRGVTMRWASVRPPSQHQQQDRDHCLRLTFNQRHRDLVFHEYLPHVRRCGRAAMFGNRRRRLYTNKKSIDYSSKVWSYIDFEHPATFDTLAMHPEKKRRIMEDLDEFRNGKEYYRSIGKPWKRGYLLYGPPGTGKSTMIAAMANYLEYDIYDIELTMVPSNSDLRKLFTETKGKSIIVIEDIDCCLDVTGPRSSADAGFDLLAAGGAVAAGGKRKRSSEMTLSGLLNFIDGIWSAHSGERIVVFTTNFVDKLDPALIRRGRMDMHVEMSYCCFEAFLTLAKNYLGVDAHPLFGAVEELLQAVEISPADVGECLMMSKRADVSLGHLVDELKKRAQVMKEEKDMKRTEAEAAADAKLDDAQSQDMAIAKPDGAERMEKRRRVSDEGDDKVAAPAKPANEAMAAANGEIASGVGAYSSSDSDSDDDGEAKGDADAEADAAETNGTVANGDLSDAVDDDMDDYDCDYDDDDMDDYDDDDESEDGSDD